MDEGMARTAVMKASYAAASQAAASRQPEQFGVREYSWEYEDVPVAAALDAYRDAILAGQPCYMPGHLTGTSCLEARRLRGKDDVTLCGSCEARAAQTRREAT